MMADVSTGAARSRAGGPPRVAIIGGRGTLGALLLPMLAERGGCRLVVVGRDLRAAEAMAHELAAQWNLPTEREPEARRLDVVDADIAAAARLFADCDVIVNAAAPSWLTSEPAARIARIAGAHFVDLGGYDALLDLIRPWHGELCAAGKVFVGSAGWMPGLSEIFTRHVVAEAERSGRRARDVELGFGARDEWSEGSVSDMIWHLEHHGESGWFENGAWTDIPSWRAGRRVAFPEPIGTERTFGVYNGQFSQWAVERPDLRIVAALGLLSLRTMLTVLAIKGVFLRRRERAVALLRKAIARDAGSSGPIGMLCVTVRDEKGAVLARGTLCERRNLWITALVAARTVAFLLDGRLKPGAHALGDAVDPAAFLASLSEAGVIYQVETMS